MRKRKMISRTMQGVVDPHAPFLVDPVVWRDVVLAELPEHELLLETRVKPDLLANSTKRVLSCGPANVLSSHHLKYRSFQRSMYKLSGLVEVLTYAATTAAARDLPSLECTKTTPPSAKAWWMNRHAAGK